MAGDDGKWGLDLDLVQMTQAMNCQLSITDSEWPNLSAATLCESEVDVSVAMFASLLKGKVI